MRLGGKCYVPASPSEAERHGISFIHQELNLFGNLSIAENFFITCFPQRRILGARVNDPSSARAKARNLLGLVRLDIAMETSVEKLAPGERQLVEIAKALSIESKIIILDEPTSSLTVRETERLFELIGRLRSQGKSMIYISHALRDVERLCDDIVVLRDGQIAACGNASDFDADRIVSEMVGRSIEQLYPIRPQAPSREILLEARGVSSPGRLAAVSFLLHAGEILGVYGLMGSGRTELARLLFGLDPEGTGEVLLEGKAFASASARSRIKDGLAFLTENRMEEGLMMEASAGDNIGIVALPAFVWGPFRLIDRPSLQKKVEACVRSLRISGVALRRQTARTLSGGNQQKVVLAKWLMAEPRAIILDEPTRGVDVGARREIYEIIVGMAERGSGILLISSEIEELMGLCDRILVMHKGTVAGHFHRGSFDREQVLRRALGQA
jgi:ribose transport system ATP-binding protein